MNLALEDLEQHSRAKDNRFQRVKVLAKGSGPFDDVIYLARDTQSTCHSIVRQVNVSDMNTEARSKIVREIQSWRKLKHPCLVQILDIFRTKGGRLCMRMEFMDDGNLQHHIDRSGGLPFSMVVVLERFAQLCLALNYIHEQSIAHGSLIPRHVFLHHSGQVKLGGFHITRDFPCSVGAEERSHLDLEKGRICPEVLDGLPYTQDSDLWALGVVLFEMSTLNYPFVAQSLPLCFYLIREAHFTVPRRLQSTTIQPLIDDLLQRDGTMRPKAQKLLRNASVQTASINVNYRFRLGLDVSYFETGCTLPKLAGTRSAPFLPSVASTSHSLRSLATSSRLPRVPSLRGSAAWF